MLEPGARAIVERTVTAEMTAQALGSGDVPVLGTPALLALMEEAAVRAVSGALEPGQTTVGARIEMDHLAPTAPGTTVTAQAVLTAVEGRRLTFAVTAEQDETVLARGSHKRVVVDRAAFLSLLR
ncbi:MAG TPA: thioesterase family protein [Actinomycetota bacterium]|jgi:predicted thioesterase